LHHVTILAANAETHSYGVFLQEGEEGTGPPPHSHHWDECFYVLKGEDEFLCDGELKLCSAGTYVHIPKKLFIAFVLGKVEASSSP
jgi:quercetin dioxygenase-like cupin family protein